MSEKGMKPRKAGALGALGFTGGTGKDGEKIPDTHMHSGEQVCAAPGFAPFQASLCIWQRQRRT